MKARVERNDYLWRRGTRWLRQALGEFLAVPIEIVAGFIVLAAAIYLLDQWLWVKGRPPPSALRWLSEVFGDSDAIGSLLGTVATSLITVTSITFSLLLIAVQQGASALTNQVVDQFLRRRGNQFYFGFFVGLSVFALINLLTANPVHRPIFGALVAVLLTAVALCLIVVLIYTTIDQMRPGMIVRAIHDHVLAARRRQLALLEATRRPGAAEGARVVRRVLSQRWGYVTAIDAAAITGAVTRAGGECRGAAGCAGGGVEVALRIVIGSHVAFRDPLAELRCAEDLSDDDAERLASAVAAAVKLDDEPNLDRDPALGIHQLATIGWVSVSTAHSNPEPGLLVCQALRDLITRWAAEDGAAEDRSSPVILDDHVPSSAISTLESLAVVASESMQHQTLAEILRSFAMLLPVLPAEGKDRIADTVLRLLSALGDHVLTRELASALDGLAQALSAAGREAPAQAVALAEQILGRSVGVLGSRATRATTGHRR